MRGGAGAAFPAAFFQAQEIVERLSAFRRIAGRREGYGASVAEPLALPVELLALLAADGGVEVVAGIAGCAQQCTAVLPEGGAGTPAPCEHCVERAGQGIVRTGREKRQQHDLRQVRVAGDMREPCGEHGLRQIAIDQGRPERSEGMRPAQQYGQRRPIAATGDAGGEQSEELRRRRARPDQAGADIAAEYRRCGQRERGLIEDVGRERAAGERAPFCGDGGEPGERPPLHTEEGFDRAVHGSDPPNEAFNDPARRHESQVAAW